MGAPGSTNLAPTPWGHPTALTWPPHHVVHWLYMNPRKQVLHLLPPPAFTRICSSHLVVGKSVGWAARLVSPAGLVQPGCNTLGTQPPSTARQGPSQDQKQTLFVPEVVGFSNTRYACAACCMLHAVATPTRCENHAAPDCVPASRLPLRLPLTSEE